MPHLLLPASMKDKSTICMGLHSFQSKTVIIIEPIYLVVISSLLEEAEGLPKSEIQSHFAKISSECQSIQKLVSDSTLFLSKFDLRTAQDVRPCVHKVSLLVAAYVCEDCPGPTSPAYVHSYLYV